MRGGGREGAHLATAKEGHSQNRHFELNGATEEDGAHGLGLHVGVVVLVRPVGLGVEFALYIYMYVCMIC